MDSVPVWVIVSIIVPLIMLLLGAALKGGRRQVETKRDWDTEEITYVKGKLSTMHEKIMEVSTLLISLNNLHHDPHSQFATIEIKQDLAALREDIHDIERELLIIKGKLGGV